MMSHDPKCVCCVCEERRIFAKKDLKIEEQATEIERLREENKELRDFYREKVD